MQSDIDIEAQRIPQHIPGPPQLPPLIKGQKLKSGPYTITVTDEMVAQRERENLELYKAWTREQRRRNLLPQEEADEFIGDFKDVIVRRSFVRKVFCLLTLQLIFTVLVVSIFMFVDEAQKFMIVHWYLWAVAIIIFIVAYCTIACSVRARRTPPFNYICLYLLTLAMSYLAAAFSVFYSNEVVLIVMGMTAVVTTIIALLATFSRYLYFDVQTIMGGRRIELSPDEIIFATTQIYVDIILLYQYLLMFVGFFNR